MGAVFVKPGVLRVLLKKTLALLFHLLQMIVSFTASWYVSWLVAACLFGSHMYDAKAFRRLFRVSPWLVSSVGSVAWVLVAALEAP